MFSLQSQKSHYSIGVILAAIAAILLAFTNIGTPGLYAAGSNPATVLLLRAMVTALSIGIVLLLTGRMQFLALWDEIFCVISGLLFMLAGFGLFTALAISPVSTVILLLYLYPLMTTVFESIVTGRFPGWMTLILMLLALFGLGLALDVGTKDLNPVGILMSFIAAVGVALTLVWNSHKLAHVDPEKVTFRMFSVNLAAFTVYVLYLDNFQLPVGDQNLLLLGFVLACFAFAFPALFRAAQMAGPSRTAMIMNLEPVISIVLSVAILMETINTSQIIGATLVIAAVLVSQIYDKYQQTAETRS